MKMWSGSAGSWPTMLAVWVSAAPVMSLNIGISCINMTALPPSMATLIARAYWSMKLTPALFTLALKVQIRRLLFAHRMRIASASGNPALMGLAVGASMVNTVTASRPPAGPIMARCLPSGEILASLMVGKLPKASTGGAANDCEIVRTYDVATSNPAHSAPENRTMCPPRTPVYVRYSSGRQYSRQSEAKSLWPDRCVNLKNASSSGKKIQHRLLVELVADCRHVVAAGDCNRAAVGESRCERAGRTRDRVVFSAHDEHRSRRLREF